MMMTLLYRLLETPLWIWVAVGVAIGLGLRARWRLDAACGAVGGVSSRRGLTGAEAAVEMLRNAGVNGVRVERAGGLMPQEWGYDPAVRVVRLRRAVFEGSSLAALGLAAHEVGHALQHEGGDAPQPLELRDAVGFAVRLGTATAVLLIVLGFLLNLPGFVAIGAVVWVGAAILPLSILPLERDAARRGRRVLTMSALVDSAEERLVGPVVESAGLQEMALIVPRWCAPAWQRRGIGPRPTLRAVRD